MSNAQSLLNQVEAEGWSIRDIQEATDIPLATLYAIRKGETSGKLTLPALRRWYTQRDVQTEIAPSKTQDMQKPATQKPNKQVPTQALEIQPQPFFQSVSTSKPQDRMPGYILYREPGQKEKAHVIEADVYTQPDEIEEAEEIEEYTQPATRPVRFYTDEELIHAIPWELIYQVPRAQYQRAIMLRLAYDTQRKAQQKQEREARYASYQRWLAASRNPQQSTQQAPVAASPTPQPYFDRVLNRWVGF